MSTGRLYDNEKKRCVISEAGRSACKVIPYGESNQTNSSCPITLHEFTTDDLVTELPCGHCFEPEMINHWLENEHAICPICRMELPSVEVSNYASDNADWDAPLVETRVTIIPGNGEDIMTLDEVRESMVNTFRMMQMFAEGMTGEIHPPTFSEEIDTRATEREVFVRTVFDVVSDLDDERYHRLFES